MKKPYIGITDFTVADEVSKMLGVFSESRAPDSKRALMVGVMISYKTLNGLETKWASVWPPSNQLADIFISHSFAMNTLHYADYGGGNDFLRCLDEVTKFGGPNLDAIQLDMIWPIPYEVLGYRWQHPEIEVVLQVGAKAFSAIDSDWRQLVSRLREYGRAIDYVLLDKSGGRGFGMDAEGLRPYLRAVHDSGLDIGLAVAGGLGPGTLHLVEPLLAEFPDLSIDAQGKLRLSGSAMDPIDWTMAKMYIQKSLKMMK